MKKLKKITKNILKTTNSFFHNIANTFMSKPSSNPDFVHLENESQNTQAPNLQKPSISFDHVLTNTIKFGKYQMISTAIICNNYILYLYILTYFHI